ELLTIKEKILIEEKLEDEKISSVEDGIKGDHFLLNKKRIIDNVDDSSTKKKMDNRIKVAEITLNKSELEVLSGENLEEAKNKTALLYTECRCLDYGVEDTKEMISLFNKKEKFFKDKIDKSKELVLEKTLVSKANLNVEDKDKMVVDRKMKAKAGFIPKNSNGNQRSVAFIYFKSQEDLNMAIENLHQNDTEVQKKTLTIKEVQRMKTVGYTKKTIWIYLLEEYKRKREKSQKYSTKSLEDSKILKKDRELMFPIAPNICQGQINRHKQAYGLALTGGILSLQF
ncbi:42576_t:CDS:2, partial [Gigaspora margarita]